MDLTDALLYRYTTTVSGLLQAVSGFLPQREEVPVFSKEPKKKKN